MTFDRGAKEKIGIEVGKVSVRRSACGEGGRANDIFKPLRRHRMHRRAPWRFFRQEARHELGRKSGLVIAACGHAVSGIAIIGAAGPDGHVLMTAFSRAWFKNSPTVAAAMADLLPHLGHGTGWVALRPLRCNDSPAPPGALHEALTSTP